MGVLITYGSYVKKDVDLNKSVAQIEVVDTVVAFLAGVMIIPAIYVFSGMDGMSAGPSLMFVALPKTFYVAMGTAGRVIGLVFFLLAATCGTDLMSFRAGVDYCKLYGSIFHTGRKKTTLVLGVIYLAATAVIALGYSLFYLEIPLPKTEPQDQLFQMFWIISVTAS